MTTNMAAKEKKNLRSLPSYLLLICFAFFYSCDQSFEPLMPNDQFFFSMFGYLDASADTQWVHITPVRGQINNTTDGKDIHVIIKNNETKHEIVMNDSLFSRGQDFLNYWTAEPLEYDQTYTIIAELATGEKSEVTVITPVEMPDPIFAIFTSPGSPSDYVVLVEDDVNLVDIQTKWYVRLISGDLNTIRTFSFPYRNSITNSDYQGYYSVEVDPEEELKQIEREVLLPPDAVIEVVYRQIFVASSAMEWNKDIQSLDDITYALPQTLRNVDQGIGYVIGIDGKYIPYEGCKDENGYFISCGAEKPFR